MMSTCDVEEGEGGVVTAPSLSPTSPPSPPPEEEPEGSTVDLRGGSLDTLEPFGAWIAAGGSSVVTRESTISLKRIREHLSCYGVLSPPADDEDAEVSDSPPPPVRSLRAPVAKKPPPSVFSDADVITFAEFCSLLHADHLGGGGVPPPELSRSSELCASIGIDPANGFKRQTCQFIKPSCVPPVAADGSVGSSIPMGRREVKSLVAVGGVPGRPGVSVERERLRIMSMRGLGKQKHIHPSERSSGVEKTRAAMHAARFQEELMHLFSPEVRLALAAASAKRALGTTHTDASNTQLPKRNARYLNGVLITHEMLQIKASVEVPQKRIRPSSRLSRITYSAEEPPEATLRRAERAYGPLLQRTHCVEDPYLKVQSLLDCEHALRLQGSYSALIAGGGSGAVDADAGCGSHLKKASLIYSVPVSRPSTGGGKSLDFGAMRGTLAPRCKSRQKSRGGGAKTVREMVF